MLKRHAVLAGFATAGLAAVDVLASAGTSSAATGWSSVAKCESGGNPSINTGNGYYGLYQFDRRTWNGMGMSGTANQYSAATQTAVAERLYAQRGSAPWPVCGRFLSGKANTSGKVSPRKHKAPAVHRAARRAVRINLGVWLIQQHRADVRAAQVKLNTARAGLEVDGQYGPLTRGVVRRWESRAGRRSDGVLSPGDQVALLATQRVRLASTRAANPGSRAVRASRAAPRVSLAASSTSTSSKAATAVRAAHAQLGDPYVWGGSGPSSFDCSGLTSYVWARAGVSLPRTARAQFASLPRVSDANRRPGDLVAFGSPIHHIAIYIGGGKMIASPHSGSNVHIQDVYSRGYRGAVRPG